MTTKDRIATASKIVSIHDMDPRGFLSFDLLQILESIQKSALQYVWIVRQIECTGEPIPTGTVLSFEQLADHALRAGQTINGTVVGCAPGSFTVGDLESVTQIAGFPKTQATVAILAVDSSYFEVFAKDQSIIDQVRLAFHDVRMQDPRDYFAEG
jgi:hypothetical protein